MWVQGRAVLQKLVAGFCPGVGALVKGRGAARAREVSGRRTCGQERGQPGASLPRSRSSRPGPRGGCLRGEPCPGQLCPLSPRGVSPGGFSLRWGCSSLPALLSSDVGPQPSLLPELGPRGACLHLNQHLSQKSRRSARGPPLEYPLRPGLRGGPRVSAQSATPEWVAVPRAKVLLLPEPGLTSPPHQEPRTQ